MFKTVHYQLLICVLLISTSTYAQQKTIASTALGTSGLTFEALMDQTAGTIVMTITGPFDRWFGAGFGSTMTNADVMLYTTGKTGALHPEGPTDYILSATSAAGVTRDAVDDFTIITNTVLATTRTITVQRDLNNSDPEDHALLFSDASLDVTYARASSAGMLLGYHGGGGARGTVNLAWTLVDVIAPIVASYTPLDNALNVAVASNLSLAFSENISANTGAITIRLASDNSLVESISILTAQATIVGNTLTINPAANLLAGTAYYVQIANGTVQDLASNLYAGINDLTTWNFTTAPDLTAPLLIASPFSPADNAVNVALSIPLVLTLNENIALGAGTISLINTATTAVVQTFNGTSSSVVGATLTLTLSASLLNNTAYHITVSNNAITDIAGNNFAGFTNATTWNFTTLALPDVTPPVLAFSAFSPADNAVSLSLNIPISLTFDENIALGSGAISLINTATSAIVQTFNAGSSSISGATISFTLATNLLSNTNYHITVANNAITDISGNNFAGFVDATTWNFATIIIVDTPPLLSALPFSPADNSTGVALNIPLTITFNENIALGSGTISLINTGTSAIVQSFNAGTASITGPTITLALATSLSSNTAYHVTVSNTAITDLTSNNFAGFTNATTWNFTTIDNASIQEETSPISYAYANQKLTISNQQSDLRSIKIINTTGQLLYENNTPTEQLIIETNTFSNQMIIIVVESNGNTWSKKLVL